MIERDVFEQERELYIESLFDGVCSMMGVDAPGIDEKRFYQLTDIALEIANFGSMDEFQRFDEFDLVAFVETMEIMVPAVENNLNIEQAFPNLMMAVNCLGLYLSLYVVEDEEVAEYCEITTEAIAAAMGVKVSTLKNMVSLKKLVSMDKGELRQFLESQERFKPFKSYNSLLLDAPLDMSNIHEARQFVEAVEKRAEMYSASKELDAILVESGVESNADERIKFVALFSASARVSARIGKLLNQLNLKTEGLRRALEQVSSSLKTEFLYSGVLENFQASAQSETKHENEEQSKEFIFSRPDVPFTSDTLGDYLKVEHGFSQHPDDRSKNKKLFAVKKGQFSLAIERTKTPCVWVSESIAKKLDPSAFDVTWYSASEDGKGRHSALHSYEEFATAKIAKVKVKSFEHAEFFLRQVA